MIRRLGAGAVCALVIFAMSAPWAPASADTGDKQLARVRGDVGYRPAAGQPVKPVLGRIDLADDAIIETQKAALGNLTLRDSSQIEIGADTSVQVGAFNTVASGNANVITLNRGALHFNVKHPAGAVSNYRFTTNTSQIAVRGTEAYLVTGPNGTQIACVSCGPGDVTVTTGSTTTSVVSGQTLTIQGSTPATASQPQITQNVTTNNPQINQFSPHYENPFIAAGIAKAAVLLDPTAAVAGSTVGAAAISTGLIATGATVAVATAVVVSDQKPAVQPVAAPPSAGALVVSKSLLQFTSLSDPPQQFMVSQSSGTGSITVSQAICQPGFGAQVSPTGPFTLPVNSQQISVTPTAAASTQATHACYITVTGAGMMNATVFIDITTTPVGIISDKRKKL